MGILRTIIIRVLYAAALLFAVLVLNFSLMHLAPGDVADTISQSMGGADQEILDEIRVSYGLDQPFIVQLGKYIANVAQFDLGYSFFYNQPVSRLILERLPATLLLVLTAQIAALIIGVVLGCHLSAQAQRHLQLCRDIPGAVWLFRPGLLDRYFAAHHFFAQRPLVPGRWHA